MPRRFDLSAEELAAIRGAQARPIEVRDMVKLLVRRPTLLPSVARSAVAGAVQGVRAHGGLMTLIGAARMRSAVPDAATGALWHADREFVDILRPHLDPGATVLEIGCGGGRVTRLVAPHVRRLTAIDLSPELLQEARENLDGIGNVTFELTDGIALRELADESFDAVFAHDVFVQLDLNLALALLIACRRVLRPGGVCALSFLTIDEPDWARHHAETVAAAARSGRLPATLIRPYVREQVDALYRAAGFDVIEHATTPTGDGTRVPHLVVVGRAPSR